jgi:hypothetical protein
LIEKFSSFIYLFGVPPTQLVGEELAFLCGGCQAYQAIPLTFTNKENNKRKRKKRKKKITK